MQIFPPGFGGFSARIFSEYAIYTFSLKISPSMLMAYNFGLLMVSNICCILYFIAVLLSVSEYSNQSTLPYIPQIYFFLNAFQIGKFFN